MNLLSIFSPSRSFGAKLTLWITATMLVIFVVVTLFIYRTTANGIFMEANARYMGLMDKNNEHVNATLKAVEAAIANAVPQAEENLDHPDRLYGVVERILRVNPDIVGSAIAFEPNYFEEKGLWFSPYAYRDEGNIRNKQLGTASYDYHYMDWYQLPKQQGKPYWSEPYFDADGGNTMMTTFSLPLYDKDGKFYAIFTADIALQWLSRMMQQTDSINNAERALGAGHAYSFIIGREGNYIAHPNPNRVLGETFFSYASQTPDTLDEHVGYEMIAGHRGNAHLDSQGKISIYYAPIERTGWSMAIVVPDEEIVAVAQQVGLMIVGLMLLGLGIVVLVCRFAISRMTTPLTRFAASADEIAQGNLDVPLPEVKSHDEMRRLHDSFLAMQLSLINQISETARVTEQKGRIESELHIARAIQMAMLPKTFPPFPDCDEVTIYGKLTPAKEVGGDLYDFYIRDQKLFFCIGDVSGKGVPASLVMAVTRALFRTISAHEENPERIVGLINNTISEDNEANMFVTLFLGVTDLKTGHTRYCNAGHNPPLLVSASGDLIGLMPADSNLPAGVMNGWDYTVQELDIFNGTTIFLYTDGLTEAEDKAFGQFGEERMTKAMTRFWASGRPSPQSVIEKMTEEVHNFVGDAEQSDDLTMMVIQYNPPNAQSADRDAKRVLVLPNDISTIPKLHAYVEAVAEDVGFDMSGLMSLNLALEEAVVNVMSYAYPEGQKGDVHIEASCDHDYLTFTIRDSGQPFDPTQKAAANTTLSLEERPVGGLGIHLVRQLMDKVSYEYIDGQNVLTLRKRLYAQ